MAAVAAAPVRWSLATLWMALALLVAAVVDASSLQVWLLVATAGVIPSAIVLRLWNEGPPATVAELRYAPEGRR